MSSTVNTTVIKEIVETSIADNKVAIFSKSYCPYCKMAKATLKGLITNESDMVILELDQREDGGDIQAYLKEKTGQSTVPNIFINEQHIGGNDSVQEAKASGRLQQLLAA